MRKWKTAAKPFRCLIMHLKPSCSTQTHEDSPYSLHPGNVLESMISCFYFSIYFLFLSQCLWSIWGGAERIYGMNNRPWVDFSSFRIRLLFNFEHCFCCLKGSGLFSHSRQWYKCPTVVISIPLVFQCPQDRAWCYTWKTVYVDETKYLVQKTVCSHASCPLAQRFELMLASAG